MLRCLGSRHILSSPFALRINVSTFPSPMNLPGYNCCMVCMSGIGFFSSGLSVMVEMLRLLAMLTLPNLSYALHDRIAGPHDVVMQRECFVTDNDVWQLSKMGGTRPETSTSASPEDGPSFSATLEDSITDVDLEQEGCILPVPPQATGTPGDQCVVGVKERAARGPCLTPFEETVLHQNDQALCTLNSPPVTSSEAFCFNLEQYMRRIPFTRQRHEQTRIMNIVNGVG
ncbi:hypothetical protein CAPTEDRAFT_204730 [Capitella teleta]|uniref:Uncharacterized protein n=1 Tax=Capitella teleta TaxID=283909 RepID=R7V038_CAPTE|nr:hypothetical protein CAPTEDRAFT_204730 [Capitella teleta]|eukprot:ELU12183.1 hypothetical protein CAPTEDRAFT_204730 [Capitella teleta]